MKIAIIGIGGIGGFIGRILCLAYTKSKEHEIVFIQRGEHHKAIKASGLKYKAQTERIVHPHEIYESTKDAGLFDLVFLAVKSRDLEQVALDLKGNLHSKSIVIPLLNGVNNVKRIKSKIPKITVINGCIYVSAYIEEAGIICQTGGAGKLVFGPINGDIKGFEPIENLLCKADIKAILSPNITKDVWDKYILISAWATISAKYKLSIGGLLSNGAIRKELIDMLKETEKVARALGINLDQDIVEICMNRYGILPYTNKTSMQLDIEAGKIPEIDSMTKYIVDTAQELKIAVPGYCNALERISKSR